MILTKMDLLNMKYGDFKKLNKIETPYRFEYKGFNIYIGEKLFENNISMSLIKDYFRLFEFTSIGMYMSMFKTSYYTSPVINIMMQENKTLQQIFEEVIEKLKLLKKDLDIL